MKPGCASRSAESFGHVTLLPSAAGFGKNLFGGMTTLADELGRQVAGATDRGASLIEAQKRTNDLLDRLLAESKKKPAQPTRWQRLLRRIGLR